jgi:hypothetical protein
MAPFFSVVQDTFGYSLHGSLASQYANPCILIIIVFEDSTVLIEHRSDLQLSRKKRRKEVMDLFQSIIDNIDRVKDTYEIR